MVSHDEVAAAFIAAAKALSVDADELGELLAVLAFSSEKELAFFPIGAEHKAIVKFVRSLSRKGPDSGSTAADAGDTTGTYLRTCLPPFDALALWGTPLQLQQCLAGRISPGLPVPASVAKRLFKTHAELDGPLVSTAAPHAAATADALAAHVRNVMDLDPYTGSEMYTARNTGIVVEDTLRLIMKYRPGPLIQMDRNKADTTKGKRPDFLCWVNGALMLKGEEKSTPSELHLAVGELTSKMSTVWAAGLLPHAQMPCMLAFAAAGTILQFFCIQQIEPGGGAQATPISGMLDLATASGRLQALTGSCNIWRLLAGYASQAPVSPLEMGRLWCSHDGSRTYCLLPGCFRKSILGFAPQHEQYASFELLQDLYGKMAQKKHQSNIIQACDIAGHVGPRLLDNTYTVHLEPVGAPCSGPPADPLNLACAVSGVLGGLAALHSEGFVHRDVRWPNVIFLPAERRWLLIDLEHAGREGCDCSGAPYPLRFWSERTLDDGKFTFRSDLRMVAEQLMGGLPYDLDDDGKNLRTQLLAGQLTATQALEHTWLARCTSG